MQQSSAFMTLHAYYKISPTKNNTTFPTVVCLVFFFTCSFLFYFEKLSTLLFCQSTCYVPVSSAVWSVSPALYLPTFGLLPLQPSLDLKSVSFRSLFLFLIGSDFDLSIFLSNSHLPAFECFSVCLFFLALDSLPAALSLLHSCWNVFFSLYSLSLSSLLFTAFYFWSVFFPQDIRYHVLYLNY